MGIDLSNTEGRAFKELLYHKDHQIEIGVYGGPGGPENVAIECMTCHTVLVDFGPDGPKAWPSCPHCYGAMGEYSTWMDEASQETITGRKCPECGYIDEEE